MKSASIEVGTLNQWRYKMSPTKIKYASTTAALLCALAIWNCGSHSTEENSVECNFDTASVALSMQYGEAPLLDSLVLDCYGTDTLHLVHSADEPNFSLDVFPSEHWKFKAKLYANGELMQMGEVETSLAAGGNATLSIQLHPIVGFVYVEIPVGLKNDAGITSGIMKLSSKNGKIEIPMETNADKIIFRSGMLKLGYDYDVEIELSDSNGNAIYKLKDKFTLSEDSPVPNLSLDALRSEVSLSIQAASPKEISITLPLKAGYRKPSDRDILITEFFAGPNKRDSMQYEFVEIYNGTIDTLILDDCEIGITSSNSTKFHPLTTSEIPPHKALVLGDVSSPNTPPLFLNTDSWSDIAATKGSIVFRCDGIVLDSLYYASVIDSLHTNVVPVAATGKNKSTQLDIELWMNKSDSTAWCLEAPTPGEISFCNN